MHKISTSTCIRHIHTHKVYTWLSETGNPFLSSSNTIGSCAIEAQELLKRHDKFESETGTVYALASQMFSKAKTLASKGDCDPERITEEAETLEGVVNSFASSLDERREIILHAQSHHQKMDTVSLVTECVDVYMHTTLL